MKKYIYTACLILVQFVCGAQLITQTVTITQLMNNLIPSGLNYSNVQLNCPQDAYGTFDGSGSNLGINQGVLLTTGNIANAVGPNNMGSAGIDNFAFFNDPELTSIEPNAQYDPCILEFDVIPQCDSLQLNFVFGSEEYLEFVNSNVNDAFGFFITGINPSGPAYNNTNIALLPGSNTPVSIDNVNSGLNSSYYFDNENPPGITVQYDGFTKKIKSKINVQGCTSYHFKIAIADGGDGWYDSGVFIEYLSCNNAVVVNTTSTPSSCTPCNGTATANATGSTPPYTYSWSGTTQNTQTVTGLCAGIYTVTVTDASACAVQTTQTVSVGAVTPVSASLVKLDPTCTSPCAGSASVTPSNGNAPYSYIWSNGANSNSISNLCAGTYSVIVQDAGGCTTINNFTLVNSNAPVIVNSVISSSCSQPNGIITTTVSSGTSPYAYIWNNNSITPSISGLLPGVYSLSVTDQIGCIAVQSITVGNSGAPLVAAQVVSVSCYGFSDGVATAQVQPVGNYSYLWSNNLTTPQISNLSQGVYSVTVTDPAGCSGFSSATITQPSSITYSIVVTNGNCSQLTGTLDLQNVLGGASGYTYSWSNGVLSALNQGLSQGVYSFTITDANGCFVSDIANVVSDCEEFSMYVPNCITADGDGLNDSFVPQLKNFKNNTFLMYIYDRWGSLLYTTNDLDKGWDVAKTVKTISQGVYVYKITVQDLNDKVHELVGHVTVLR